MEDGLGKSCSRPEPNHSRCTSERIDRMGNQCGMGVDETVEHMVMECQGSANEMEVL